MSTLRYADQAKSIINTAKVNDDPFARTVKRLEAEVCVIYIVQIVRTISVRWVLSRLCSWFHYLFSSSLVSRQASRSGMIAIRV